MMGSQSSRIAAYKMCFDYVGCELDKEYFDKGCERFNRECKCEIKLKDGSIVKQASLW
jgi:site-specific DNA-methyltransferase (adenine-specific)